MPDRTFHVPDKLVGTIHSDQSTYCYQLSLDVADDAVIGGPILVYEFLIKKVCDGSAAGLTLTFSAIT